MATRTAAVFVAGAMLCSGRASAQEAEPLAQDATAEMPVAPYVGIGALAGAATGLFGAGLYCGIEGCDDDEDSLLSIPPALMIVSGLLAGAALGAEVGLLVGDTAALIEGRPISTAAIITNFVLGAFLIGLGISYALPSGGDTLEASLPLMGIGTLQIGLGVSHLFPPPAG